ncbi:oxidoreductase [Legionella qingyii]|uniref:Oxidoreductase n=1 Tax=Legionella qingyii TaxID=2184757 RepID=A0A317U377_9GAMM|nr:oxidoreductase [Legionella qingyii]PWY55698.1 oxidoreductase [Legionella qingyii]RUR21634.1 oxidoreductase [Legionella qingyii]RUR25098.1 oxidoreductase [Legionella qingyii]
MGKGIILRVPHGTELSAELLEALAIRFPGYILETYHKKPDNHRSFVRRVNSLHKAFSFLLDAYPLAPQSRFLLKSTLEEYVNECEEDALHAKGSMDELHKELEKYTAKLIELIALGWGTSIKEAIELLNEAEQYELMRQGRYDLATLTPMKLNDDDYILQIDESLPPYYEQFINELKQIKASKYPKTPSWVCKLEEYQQAYFCNLNRSIGSYIEVVQDFNSFLIEWALIKKRAINFNVDLKQIATNSLPLPAWFNELGPHLQEMIRVLALDPSNLEYNLSKFKKLIFSESFKKECSSTVGGISSIPQWYWVLSEHQQFFLEHVLKGCKRVEDAVTYLSSRHRTLPLPANYAVHSLLAVSQDGKFRELSKKRYRSSHVATRDGLTWPGAVQQRHIDSNLAKVMENAQPDQLAILQTLISPIHAADYVPTWITDYLPTLPPDLELYKLARAAVERRAATQTILQNNHPYNLAKRLYYTQSNDKDSLNLLAVAEKYVSSTPGLKTLLEEYKSVLESATGTATIFDYAGRELFLSSLEQLIILSIGGHSYGSCVSGKDRKAIELIHTDAMILYKELYGCWPVFDELYDKKNRIRFVSLVADLYMSRHHHEHAGQNAPGSEGIKTPDWYLPEDIATEIKKRLDNERALKDDDRVATDNEVKNIFIGGSKKVKEYVLPKNTLLCRLVARQLGKTNCNRLYDSLHLLINEKSLFTPVPVGELNGRWSVKFFSETVPIKYFSEPVTIPDGIKQIFDLMLSPTSGKDNIERFEKIFQIILDRPESDESRAEATNSVYGRARDFFKPHDDTDFTEMVEKTVEEWSNLFTKSKESHLGETCLHN